MYDMLLLLFINLMTENAVILFLVPFLVVSLFFLIFAKR